MTARKSGSKSQRIVINKTNEVDLPLIARIEARTYGEESRWSLEEYQRDFVKNDRVYLTAKSKNEIAGWLVLHIREKSSYVVGITVVKKYRGQGLGKKLMLKALEISRQHQKPTRLHVKTSNKPAIRLYENLGFKKRRKILDYYKPNMDAYEMIKAYCQ